jgi:hypothetical protein
MQLATLKMYDVKMREILSIILIFYCLLDSKNIVVPRLYRQLFYCFFLFAVSSFLVLFWVDIYPNSGFWNITENGMDNIIPFSRIIRLFIPCFVYT